MEKKRYLITGGAGFVGSSLAEELHSTGNEVIIFDKIYDKEIASKYPYFKGDIRNASELDEAFEEHGPFNGVFHAAALLALLRESKKSLWETNVSGTENVVNAAIKHNVLNFVFISSSCVYGKIDKLPAREESATNPVDTYGKSKLEAEIILKKYEDKINTTCFRCPTIVSAGRLGILFILFEFIKDNNNVYVVGSGRNKHHVVDIKDANRAFRESIDRPGFHVYNVASKEPESLRSIFEEIIKRANSNSKVKSLPENLAIGLMKLAFNLRISPLGPYHFNMMSEDLILDTKKIEEELDWSSEKKNIETFLDGYNWYIDNHRDIHSNKERSVHRSPSKMGIIRMLKYFS